MILRKRAVVLLAASAPGLGLAQGGFATYDTVFESLPVIPPLSAPLSPGDETREAVTAAVRRGEIPASDAPRVIRETAAGSADGTTLSTMFLPAFGPKGGPTPIIAEPAWEMMRAGVTYRLDQPGRLRVSAGDDLRPLGSWAGIASTRCRTRRRGSRGGSRSSRSGAGRGGDARHRSAWKWVKLGLCR